MRLDPDTSNSNGTHRNSNGSSTSPLNNSTHSNPNSANGHSSTNGTASPHKNRISPTTSKTRSSNYFGHDREEVTRLLIQGLGDLGYYNSAERLSVESGYEVEAPSVAAFRHAVLQGEWAEAEALLFGTEVVEDGGGVSISNGDSQQHGGLQFAENVDKNELKFRMREQKYLELLEERDLGGALAILRQELTPLNQATSKLHELSSLIVCQSAEDLKSQARWDGALGGSRHILLEELSKSISPSVMIPEHRLAVLLSQVKQNQISKCLYHNPHKSPSLFADHICDRSQFPLQTVRELREETGEVWFLEFSPNGRWLATSGQGSAVMIYDTEKFKARHILSDHTDHVPYLSWSPDSSRLITCSHDKRAKVWDMNSGQCTLTIEHHGQPVTTAAWAPDGQTLVTGSLDLQTQLCLWNLDGDQVYAWATNYRILDCAISPDGQRLVTISSENQIFVYNFVTREQLYCIVLRTKMTCINISRDSRYMLVNMAENEVQLIDIETAEVVRRFLGQRQSEFIIRSAFGGADENLIISGSEDSRVYIWHKENGTLIETLEGHVTGCVNAVAWNPADHCMFASAGDDQAVRIWSKEDALHARRRDANDQRHTSRYRGSATML